ncbi:MAG TPA: hypothetical protein VKR21_15625 [Solirubrobacteraceae bacterium]|nr:hypothetical protein [Solirubrobacteraceae bacterium]
MSPEIEAIELVAFAPDERLLGDDLGQLPPSLGRPAQLPASRVRGPVVGLGATLTGVTLVLGVALVVFGVVEAILESPVVGLVSVLVGVLLAGTHWGWVHVAELSANRLALRGAESFEERRRQWLAGITPYTRWDVQTSAADDGSITIETVRYEPVACRERTFTFVRELEAREVHSGDEPAAAVTERAELLRREAAARTEQAREHFEVARDAYERTLMARDDEEQRRAALRAASEALSERINANLRDPPLTQ